MNWASESSSTKMTKVLPNMTSDQLETAIPISPPIDQNASCNSSVKQAYNNSPTKSRTDEKLNMKLKFFSGRSPKRSEASQLEKHEDVSISFFTLQFSDTLLETRYLATRVEKYATRLKFGGGFTAFFIPLLLIMRVCLHARSSSSEWAQMPLAVIFPGITTMMGLLTIFFRSQLQARMKVLALVCLVGQVCALLDVTAAGTYVNERNIWVQFIFSLGVASCTGLPFVESIAVLSSSGFFLIIIAWVCYAIAPAGPSEPLSTPGTITAAILLYSILLAFLVWNWEYEERRDFVLSDRLAQDNVMVHMTMEMTGWFSGGVASTQDNNNVITGVLSANCHIDPSDVTVNEELGEGTFGCVYAAIWKETLVAVKKITLQGDLKAITTSFGAEASVMAQLRHPNVVMFMGVMVHPDFVGLVMELCPKGNMYTAIHASTYNLDWSLLMRMLLDSARGMHFLHTSHPPILHRDLKSMNLLIDSDWRCKVSDFGLSKLKAFRDEVDNVATNGKRSFVGSSVWIAPEIFAGEMHTEKADVYSFGVILFEGLSSSMPYKVIAIDAVPFVVQSGKRPTDFHQLDTPADEGFKSLHDLMVACWNGNKDLRPSFAIVISTIQNALVHYVGQSKWDSHIIYPDRRLSKSTVESSEDDGLSIKQDDLLVEDSIGRGVFGVVYKGLYFGTPVAIKKLHVSGVPQNTLIEFDKECNIMKGLHHPNIVLFMGYCSKPPTLLLVTELLENGSFFDIYHKSSPPDTTAGRLQLVYNMAFDMSKGLAYLHNHNPSVIHRDLKSQNILLDDKMRTKIGDFGLSKFRDVGKTLSICGSPLWVAPEVLRGEKYGCACDVYSFSIIVWEALAWDEPYPSMGSSDIMNGVAGGFLRPKVPELTPHELAALLEECWMRKQNERPTFNEIIPRLEAMMNDFMVREHLK